MTLATDRPPERPDVPPFGHLLKQWRLRRRLTQLELAHGAGVSTRHLSFVETGRSAPSRDMVLHLAGHLGLPLRERNRLLEAPGEPDPLWLEGIEAGLAETGAELARARMAVIAGLTETLADLPEAPFARPGLAYVAGGPVEADALRGRRGAHARADTEKALAKHAAAYPEVLMTSSAKGTGIAELRATIAGLAAERR